MKALVILPVYNEEENIELLLSNIESKMKELNAAYHVILVNDGSTDSTKERALKFKNRIQKFGRKQKKNCGRIVVCKLIYICF